MRKLITLVIIYSLLLLHIPATAQTTISTFDEFIPFAKANSLTIKNGEIQLTQAKKAKLASLLGIIDPAGNASFSYTNNTQLPINLIASEILGGAPGTFKEVRFGVQYNSNFNTYVEAKLLNLQGWEDYKLSKLNIKLTEGNNKLSIKSLFENSANIFFNIATLNEQLKSANKTLFSADTLYNITLNKYQAGLINQQILNESIINRKEREAEIDQIKFLIKEQYIALKLICDIPDSIEFVIDTKEKDSPKNQQIEANNLLLNIAQLNYQSTLSNYRKAKYAFMPSISLLTSISNQQFNTKNRLLDNSVSWIPSSYIGFRLSVPLPSASSIAAVSKAKYDSQLAFNDQEKAKIKTHNEFIKLQIEYNKALSQIESNKAVYLLRKENYEKNVANFKEGLIGLDVTLKSFTEMVNSNYSLLASEKMVALVLTKILINNTIK
jgi:outer membrane protein TolC